MTHRSTPTHDALPRSCIHLIFTFRMRHSQGEMYIGHRRLCVSLSVCLSPAAFRHYRTDPDVTWGNGRGSPVAVHYWADLQLVHGFRCYDNIQVCKIIVLYTANVYSAEQEMSASTCTRSMAGLHYCRCWLYTIDVHACSTKMFY